MLPNVNVYSTHRSNPSDQHLGHPHASRAFSQGSQNQTLRLDEKDIPPHQINSMKRERSSPESGYTRPNVAEGSKRVKLNRNTERQDSDSGQWEVKTDQEASKPLSLNKQVLDRVLKGQSQTYISHQDEAKWRPRMNSQYDEFQLDTSHSSASPAVETREMKDGGAFGSLIEFTNHIKSIFTGPATSPASAPAPASAAHVIPSERRKFPESSAESLAQLKSMETQLQDAHEALDNARACHEREITEAMDSLEEARATIQRRGQALDKSQRERTNLIEELNRARAEHEQLARRVNDLLQEKGTLNALVKQYRKAEAIKPTHNVFSLDAFDNTLDQVSEAHIKANGHPSVDGLNDDIDTMVQNALDCAFAKSETYAADRSELKEQRRGLLEGAHEPFFIALSKSGLTEDNRGLLLDAFIHHVVVRELHRLFFSCEAVSIAIPEAGILETIFGVISANEPWTSAQRWRALVASSIAKVLHPSLWEDDVTRALEEIISYIAWAYCVPATLLEDLHGRIRKELTAIYRDAHELSVITKRDILSVRMSVTRSANTSDGFDPAVVDSVWPDMGVKQGDEVLGDYNLGLMKRTEAGDVSYLTRPKVITVALLRQLERV